MGKSGHKPGATKGFCCLNLSLAGYGTMSKKPNDILRLLVASFIGVVFGFLVGVSVSLFSPSKVCSPFHSLYCYLMVVYLLSLYLLQFLWILQLNPVNYIVPTIARLSGDGPSQNQTLNNVPRIWVQSNPTGAEKLPPGIVQSASDFYLHRLWGDPEEDLPHKPKYLVTFTVGYDLRDNIDAAVKKFSEDFTILLFHYDGRTTEWDQFEWSKRAIHVSARKQTKWWFAKRFLHPDIVAPYDYIFVWDEDLGVDNFNAEKYIDLVKKYRLEISQPGLEPNSSLTWRMTERRNDSEVHKATEEKPGWCTEPHLPPCAGFVEIMAPVFSRDAWRCVWHIIQNDLVHGWGLDFALQKCVQPAHEKIGVVDAQWIVHKRVPSLGNQGENSAGQDAPWRGVRLRCQREWKIFKNRLKKAEQEQAKYMQG